MGVDCRIMLPGNVRLRDVMTVMAAAAGYEVKRNDFGNNNGWSARAEGVHQEPAMGITITTLVPTIRAIPYMLATCVKWPFGLIHSLSLKQYGRPKYL